jgi:hypothetical protein
LNGKVNTAMKAGRDAGKGADMLTNDLLKAIQDDHEREFVAAQRAHSVTHRTEGSGGFWAWLERLLTAATPRDAKPSPHAGTAATDGSA